MRRLVARELARRRLEDACDPVRLARLEPPGDPQPHPQLTAALDRALGRLDAATSAGLAAVAAREPLTSVAADHDLSAAALRQRMVRARRRLRPQLAEFAGNPQPLYVAWARIEHARGRADRIPQLWRRLRRLYAGNADEIAGIMTTPTTHTERAFTQLMADT